MLFSLPQKAVPESQKPRTVVDRSGKENVSKIFVQGKTYYCIIRHGALKNHDF